MPIPRSNPLKTALSAPEAKPAPAKIANAAKILKKAFLVIFMRLNLNFFSAPVNLVRHNIYATVAL